MSKVFVASSPGRLDVMGGIADYSGSLVLQMPIRNKTTVSVTLRNDYRCALNTSLIEGTFNAEFNYDEIAHSGYEEAHEKLNQHRITSWIAYVLGCVVVLRKEKGIDFKGADFTIESDVPLGKGVSSSAAIEVATMKALGQAFQLTFQRTELSRLAQRVENVIVGAPCGLMDQLASYFGTRGELLPILCQPDLIQPPVPIPGQIKFIGIDSGVRHAVSGSSYSDVRCASFMGYSIIAQYSGVTPEQIAKARETGNWTDLPFGGYLCNIPVSEFENKYKSLLPSLISGADFIKKYRFMTDAATSINPSTTYHILNCTAHPIYENERVVNFKSLISNFNEDKSTIEQLGKLMYESHSSYSRCGLGSERTDEIVELARQHESSGIYGAKITGGGSGGTVCLLTVGDEGIESAKKIHRTMETRYKTKLAWFD